MTIAVCHPEILIEYLFFSTDSNGANVCNACDEDLVFSTGKSIVDRWTSLMRFSYALMYVRPMYMVRVADS